MSGSPNRVFISHLARLAVFDPLGNQVGRVRDVVVAFRAGRLPPLVVGLVLQVPGRRRVFLPCNLVTSVDSGQVIMNGLLNFRRFEQRPAETLVLADLLDRQVRLLADNDAAIVEDVAMTQLRTREWVISKVSVRRADPGNRIRRRLGHRGESLLVDYDQLADLTEQFGRQGAANLLATFASLKPADIAAALHGLSAQRRIEVAAALDDAKLADVLEELPEDDQVEIVTQLVTRRAANVLEAMEPDDAADLLSQLPADTAEGLLRLMEPQEAAPLRRLLTYDEDSAGGLMTTNPVILAPDASVAEALAVVRRVELSPALASSVFVCRPPLETPSGQFLGLVHIQRLLREPPQAAVGSSIDGELEGLPPSASLDQVTRLLATYNLVSVPIVDPQGHLLGAVTVDDVLDHILPADWRDSDGSSPSNEPDPPEVSHGQ